MPAPIAITMGDASGVGPEILLRTLNEKNELGDIVVFGDLSILNEGLGILNVDVPLHPIENPRELKSGVLNVYDCACLQSLDLTPGHLNVNAGKASYQYVVEAVQAALRNEVAAVVTLPMNKEATQRTYQQFSGHTELLAELCEVEDVVMMLATDDVAVSHVSTHISLRQAIEALTPTRLKQTIELTYQALVGFKSEPRIGVCGLNPHAGENGLFGSEEQTIIEPVIRELQARGMQVSGPFPADTVFRQAIKYDRFDALICMYHDQGHAPMKLHAFDRAVNVTLGLPIIRTSVDHGTAFDIAWKGVASIDSLTHATRYARKLVQIKQRQQKSI